jgi:vacuolar-type H+-ATPase subunit H
MKVPIELTPLDQIRQAEVDLARQVAAAREAAEQVIANANAQAAQLKNDAREQGKREGLARYQDIINNAEEEARAIIAQGQRSAEELRRKGSERMQIAVSHALSIVIELDKDVRLR